MVRSQRMRALAVGFATATLAISIAAGNAAAHRAHTVQPGESLWSIAAANGLGVEELAADNGLAADAHLIIGTVVQVPEGPSSAQAVAGTGACVWDCNSPVHPHPTDETVSPELVGEAAARYGMSPSLVQTIAAVESGFSNAAVSNADARGVMQILPETWQFIDEALIDGALPTASASANVEAGVAYLHHLYHLKGGDRTATIGSYHQGPHRDTLLAETHGYVDLVTRRQAEFAGGG